MVVAASEDEGGLGGKAAVVSIYNYQKYRHIQAPGWNLGWMWAKKDPTFVDLLPGTPYNMQIANCCKGVLNSWLQDPVSAVASFQISVGRSGTTNYTVKAPLNFTLKAPGPGYSCGVAQEVKPPTKFISQDGRRTTQAHVTWNVTCMYSQFVAQRAPTCCVSLSSFYNETIVNCPQCSCGCQNNITRPGSCVEGNSPYLAPVVNGPGTSSLAPLVQCTPHMCPIRVHWHVKLNYREYWRVKITVTNWNCRMNYSQWNLVVQHPNFDKVTTIFSFNYKSLNPYGVINDTGMLCDLLMVAGPDGNVQSELLFRKDPSMFTFDKGWAFPRRIYFNGDSCVMPPPDVLKASSLVLPIAIWTALLFLSLRM
ncbi:COBRA-like protein 2 [Setaria italica]|nr:COBRA-like protein 2 [Setaria italica]